MPEMDKLFAGSIPSLYEAHLVPLIFQPYADDLAERLGAMSLTRLLELAAGTGVVTRALTAATDEKTAVVATDLNQSMIDHARTVGTSRQVEWRQADAMQLPFDDGTFDAVVCQFGAMFFPDKGRAFAETRRVLRPSGLFVFSVWDRIEENEFADVVTIALESVFPEDPPRFLARTPHGYHDRALIERNLTEGGFAKPARIETVAKRSHAASPSDVAIAYCQGTPLRNEIETRDPTRLAHATKIADEALAKRFGRGAIDGKIQAHIVIVRKDGLV